MASLKLEFRNRQGQIKDTNSNRLKSEYQLKLAKQIAEVTDQVSKDQSDCSKQNSQS